MKKFLVWLILVLLVASLSGLSCAKPAAPPSPGMLKNAFGYSGKYPQTAMVSYTPRDGQLRTVSAFPGQVEVFFGLSVSMDSAQAAIKTKGGSVQGQIPLLGYYLVGVAPGSEGSFVSSILQDPRVSLALPNIALSATQDEVTVNLKKAVPLNVKPGIIVLDYFVKDTHGRDVIEEAEKGGGTVGTKVEIGTKPGSGGTSRHMVGLAIVAATEGNRIFNPGEPSIINLSTSGRTQGYYDSLSDAQKKLDRDSWEAFTRAMAQAVSSMPQDVRDNLAVVNAAGNSHMPIAEPLASLRKDPAIKDALDNNFLLVTTALKGATGARNYANGDPDVAVMNNPEAARGTSLASPAAAAALQQVKKGGGSVKDALQAVKQAVKDNPNRELVLPEALRARQALVAAPKVPAPPTPKPAATPGVTPTPKPTATPPGVTPTPKPTATPPGVTPTPKPTATPALSAARDLTGTWKGSGVYYYVDKATGQRLKTVTVDVTLEVVQRNNTVTANMWKRVVKQEPPGEVYVKDPGTGYTRYSVSPVTDEKGPLQGTVSATTLILKTDTTGYTDLWEFTFTTDLMSGGFHTQMFWAPPFEIKSDPKAFSLVRQK